MRVHALPHYPPQPNKHAKQIGFTNFVEDISRFYTREKTELPDGSEILFAKESFRHSNRVAASKKSARYPKPIEQCVQMPYVQNNNNKQFRSILVVDIDDADLEKGENSKTLQNIHYLSTHGLTPNIIILNPLNKQSLHLQFYIERTTPDPKQLHKNLHEQERFDALVQRLNILFHGDFQNRSLSIKNPFSDLYLNCVSVLRQSYWQLKELCDMSLFVYNHKFTKGRVCFTAVYNAHNKKEFSQAARKYFAHWDWDSEFKNPFARFKDSCSWIGNNKDGAVLFFDKNRLNQVLSPILYAPFSDDVLLKSLVDYHSSRNVGLFRFLCKKTFEFIQQGNNAELIHQELCMRGRSTILNRFIRASICMAESLNLPDRELRSIINSVRRYAQSQYVPQVLNSMPLKEQWGTVRVLNDNQFFLTEEEQNYKSSPFTIKDLRVYFEKMTQRVKERYAKMRAEQEAEDRRLCAQYLAQLQEKGMMPPVLFDDNGFPTWLSKKGLNGFYQEYWLGVLNGEQSKDGRKQAKLLAKYLYQHIASPLQQKQTLVKLQERKEKMAKQRLEHKLQMLGQRLSQYYTYAYLPSFACNIEENGLTKSPLLAFVLNLWENIYCDDKDLEHYRWRTLSYQERKKEIQKGFKSSIAQALRDDMNRHPDRYQCLFKNPERFDKGQSSKYRLDYQVFQESGSLSHIIDEHHELNTKLLPISPSDCERYANVYQYLKVEQAIQHFADLHHLKHGQKTYDNLFVHSHDTEARMLAKIFYQDKNKRHDRFLMLRRRKSEVENGLYRDDFNILKGDFELVKKFLSLELRTKMDLYKHKLHNIHSGLVQLFDCLSLPHITHFQFNH